MTKLAKPTKALCELADEAGILSTIDGLYIRRGMKREGAFMVFDGAEIWGDTYVVCDQIKHSGGRWDATRKAWNFDSWDGVEAALNEIIKNPTELSVRATEKHPNRVEGNVYCMTE